ncbi:MAG: YitT family protein [Lachnospiraceae bacterium]|nr:YitT family protein [Lachnospiraceae bacterium]
MAKIVTSKRLTTLLEFLIIGIGAIIAAFAIEEFLVPNTILDGGDVGMSIMINHLTGFSLSILTLCFNLPFLLIGYRKLGKTFILKSAYGMVIFSAFLKIFEKFANATSEYLLAVSFGGVILGVGVGLVIRYGGCLDGSEAVAIIINKTTKAPVGQMVLIFNIIIYSVAGRLFGFDRAMYSLLTYFIASKIIDFVEIGMNQSKAAMIITNDAEHISKAIYKKLGRTVTIMEGEGLVSGKKVVLYCVITSFEVRELRDIIRNTDQSAFVAISDVSEIIGHHMKKNDGLEKEDKTT